MSNDQVHITGVTNAWGIEEAIVVTSTVSRETMLSALIDLGGFQQQSTSLKTDLAEQRAITENYNIARREDAKRIVMNRPFEGPIMDQINL